ncbi:MAG: tetratricopeptide repeat protein [bacterium]
MAENKPHDSHDKAPEVRLFIPSTFIDLQPEREQLIKKIFPQIRALCRERGLDFTEIDLRWGITDEEARTGKIIRICLEEIDRCRPYFLGIIGSRYGWIPSTDVAEHDPKLFEEYPWLRPHIESGKSITDIEFSYGAILKKNIHSAVIYEQVVTRSDSDSGAIDHLRSRIEDAGVPQKIFRNPQELGEHVLADLWAMIERDWPAKREPTEAERERSPHEAFARNRTHSYIANPEYEERFSEFVNSADAPLVLWGKSGFGKSALMAHLSSHYHTHHHDAFIIRHFVGASSGASSMDDVMRHIMLEIKERYSIEDELPKSDLQSEFPQWLAKIPEGEKLILMIDAVNQLSGIGNEMHWLPEFIPSNVRLIISTTPELPLEQLRKRNWHFLEIQPLSPTQRKRITHEYLAHYHKHLSDEQLEIIGHEEKLDSPLFLRTLLEELRIFGYHVELGDHLADYLRSADEAELFQKVLARMERDYGTDTVQTIMTAIWASRFGLSETELLGITQISRFALSEFLIALEFHLMRRAGQFTFFHNYLREAVERRYVSDDIQKKSLHQKLANYFANEDYSERRLIEEPYQWESAQDWERYKSCLCDIEFITPLIHDDRRHELLALWKVYREHFDLSQTYHDAITEYEKTCTDEKKLANLYCLLGSALVSASLYDEAGKMLETSLQMATKVFDADDLFIAEVSDQLATCYYYRGKYAEAEEYYRKAISIRTKILGENDPLTAKSLNNLGIIFYSLGKYSESGQAYEKAIASYRNHYGGKDHAEIASILNNLGTVFYVEKKYEDAIDAYEKSIEMYERLYGKNYPGRLSPIGNIALSYQSKKEYTNAEKKYTEAIVLSQSIYGDKHRDIAVRFSNLAVLHSRFMGKHDEALTAYKEAITIFESLLEENHIDTVSTYINFALAQIRAGNWETGESIYKTYEPLEKSILGESHSRVITHRDTFNELQKK